MIECISIEEIDYDNNLLDILEILNKMLKNESLEFIAEGGERDGFEIVQLIKI